MIAQLPHEPDLLVTLAVALREVTQTILHEHLMQPWN
jgi:hypothetical protein